MCGIEELNEDFLPVQSEAFGNDSTNPFRNTQPHLNCNGIMAPKYIKDPGMVVRH